MKNYKTIRNSVLLIFLLLSVIFTTELEAECQNCTGSNLTHVMETPKFAPEWSVIYSNSVKGGQYILFEVKKDFVYRWSTLGSEDYHPDVYPTRKNCTTDADCGTGTECVGITGNKRCELAFDTELTLSRNGCGATGEVLAYNWNAVFRNQSEVEWKSDFNGTIYLYVTKYSCDTTTDLHTTVKWQMLDSTQCDTCQYDSPRPHDGTDAHKNPANAPSWTKVGNSTVDYPDPDNPTIYRQCTDFHPTYEVLGYEFGYCFGYVENIKGGDHQTYTVEEGKWYSWTTCSDPNFDTQLTLFRGDVCGMSFLAYSDDVEDPSCATNLQSTIVWKAEFSGNVTLLTNRYNCSICYQSPNIHDPFGHCSYTSLEWQRYDCHNCIGGLVGTYTPNETAATISGITKNKYIEFNLTAGREYRFTAVSTDTTTTFKPTLTMRIKGATPCSEDTIAQGDEIVWKPIEDTVVEILVSGKNCSDTGSKTASVEHQVIYDPSERFEDDPEGWTGITLDIATDLYITDLNVYANTWEEAFNACLDYEFSYTTGTVPKEEHTLDDWRLPNINEISSVIDYDLYDKATDLRLPSYVTDKTHEGALCTVENQDSTCVYPEYVCSNEGRCVRNNWYWSGTSVYNEVNSYFAWALNVMDGRTYRALKDDYHDGTSVTKTTRFKVLCVRGATIKGLVDTNRAQNERIISGWACDGKDYSVRVPIFFNFYDSQGKKTPRMTSEYDRTDIIPQDILDVDPTHSYAAIWRDQININCGGTADTRAHAFEFRIDGGNAKEDHNDISDDIYSEYDNGNDPYKPYTVTVRAEVSAGKFGLLKTKFTVPPERRPFVLIDECGDGFQSGVEQCDDGNTVTEVCGYNQTCLVCDEFCKEVPGYTPQCGDGQLDRENCTGYPDCQVVEGANETCDDGNTENEICDFYGSGTCVICNETCQLQEIPAPRCGDGRVDRHPSHDDPSYDPADGLTTDVAAMEQCDDGNSSNKDRCTNECKLNVCGDGHVWVGTETCDDGVNNGEYENQCDPGPCCNETCTGDGPKCGDGILQRQDCSGGTWTHPVLGAVACEYAFGAAETCDNGVNNGTWSVAYDENSCNMSCSGVGPYCGDGIISSAHEVCDDGANNQDNVYGVCNTTCSAKPRCGDGIIQSGMVNASGDIIDETCDHGTNNGLYGYCNTTCTALVHCGDAIEQTPENGLGPEECDVGKLNFTNYDINEEHACKSDCTIGGYCGDNIVDTTYGELCDKGNANVSYLTASGYMKDCIKYEEGQEETACKWAHYCGDSFVDRHPDNNCDPALIGCDPVTGISDDIDAKEWCDNGIYNGQYNRCRADCLGWGPFCGDGTTNVGYEECDKAGANSDLPGTTYNGSNPSTATCRTDCEWAACGDGIIDGGEDCDCGTESKLGAGNWPAGCSGFNSDILPDRCRTNCRESTCGDGVIDSAETCDKGGYNSDNPGTVFNGSNHAEATCRTNCEWATCGDGIVDNTEACDDGWLNGYYGHCNDDCTGMGPYCGDGTRDDVWGYSDAGDRLHFRFDEGSGTTATDSSGNIAAKTINGTINWVVGRYGNALDFDGTTYIDLGNPAALQITGDMTIEMWLKPNDFAARRNPYAKAYGGEGTVNIETNGSPRFYYGTTGANSGTSGSTYQSFTMNTTLDLNKWNHIVLVRDLTNMQLKWYKNGQLINTAAALFSSATASTNSAYVGQGYVSRFQGEMDELRVTARALAEEEIIYIPREECDGNVTPCENIDSKYYPGVSAACVGCKVDDSVCKYCGDSFVTDGEQCDDGISYTVDALCTLKHGSHTFYTGSTANCSDCNITSDCHFCGDGFMTSTSGQVLGMRLEDNYTNDYGTNGSGSVSWINGKWGRAAQFNGSTSNITVPNYAAIGNLSTFTVETWVRSSHDVITDADAILTKDNWAMWHETHNGISFVVDHPDDSSCGVHYGPDINTWTHVAATFSNTSGELTLYVNGFHIRTEVCAGSMASVAATSLSIGKDKYGEIPFTGDLDEIRIYNRVLSNKEVVANMNKRCDDGANNGVYGSGCSSTCTVGGPRCGDGVVQSEFGEICDNGASNDDSGVSGGAGTCWTNCTKHNPKGTYESASSTLVKGWSCDEDVPGTNIWMHVYFWDKNWTHLHTKGVQTGITRNDVQTAGHCTAINTHGWQFNPQSDSTLWTKLYNNRHLRPFKVRAYGINIPAAPPGTNPSFGDKLMGGYCGDGAIQSEFAEVCDSGDLAGKTCADFGFNAGTLACNANCEGFDTSSCSTCGDGIISGVEVCDTNGPNLNGKTCATISSTPGSTHDFSYTGSAQSWVVPDNVTSVTVETWGAQGGSAGAAGGYGGYAKGTLAVTPGQTLYIYVGQKGHDDGGVYAFNGGGRGNGYRGGGGGGSDVRQGGTALSNRKIVAGGGGGNYSGYTAGTGGGTNGGDSAGYPAGGGTQTGGGWSNYCGTDGVGNFGSGGSALCTNTVCGGGGGWYGGGIGIGGGGGSGYIGGVTGGTMSNGVRTGHGLVRITVPEVSEFDGGTLSCKAGCMEFDTSQCAKCGNGIVEPGETCDDGNLNNYDGCNSSCQIEDTHTCSGSPSTCLLKPGRCPGNVACSNNSSFVSQTVPTYMDPGGLYSVTVTMNNTGNTAWGEAAHYRLGSQNPGDNTTWGMSRVYMGTTVVQPGQNYSFTWNVTAPSVDNFYDFQWRMLREGVQWFGALSTNVKVQVGTPPCVVETFNFGYSGSIVNWTVPTSHTYRIEAYGAQGGTSGTNIGGYGARMRGDLNLTEGTVLKILVGGQGGTGTQGGGGGGTFVTNTSNSPYIIAGGGGGAHYGGYTWGNTRAHGVTTANGITGADAYYGVNAGPGGTAPNGGGYDTYYGCQVGAGGGGLTGNGTAYSDSATYGGKSFTNGGAGGAGIGSGGAGGFGGGGGGDWSCYTGGGGGGGYGGGGGGSYYGVGGGGGSYNAGSNQSNTAGARSGHGYLTITRVCP